MLPGRKRETLVSETLQCRRIAASVVGLAKTFARSPVLKDISFDIAEGETLVLLGASGSGKTTILRIIAGLEQPDRGRVVLHGRDVTDLPARQRGVGVIFQSYALFPKMSVEQNIGYGLRIRRRPRKEIRAVVDHLLELVRLKDHRQKYPAQLSGGQQQRVAIARTLAYRPEVLLFDEPFGALDAQTRTHLRSEIRALLRKVKVPSIFITHDQEEAMELGDRIAVINDGQIEQIGTPQEIYDQPATEYVATFVGRANLLRGVVRQNSLQLGYTLLQLRDELNGFADGDSATLVFRPEDVRLTKGDPLPRNSYHLCSGVVAEVNFAGAVERLVICPNLHSQQFNESVTAILVTRLQSEASASPFKLGDQVQLGLASLTVLPSEAGAVARLSRRAHPQAHISADGDSALLNSRATAPRSNTSERSMYREPEIC